MRYSASALSLRSVHDPPKRCATMKLSSSRSSNNMDYKCIISVILYECPGYMTNQVNRRARVMEFHPRTVKKQYLTRLLQAQKAAAFGHGFRALVRTISNTNLLLFQESSSDPISSRARSIAALASFMSN